MQVSDAHKAKHSNKFEASLAAGSLAGKVGGLAASWLMVEFQHRIWPAPKGDGGESSTTKLARRLNAFRSGHRLTDKQAETAGTFVHYALGAGLGLIYGAGASSKPAIASGAGLPFGVVTEMVFDQALVPALGLSNPFWKCPAAWHVRGLAAHLVFGLGTEASRRLILLAIDAAAPAAADKS